MTSGVDLSQVVMVECSCVGGVELNQVVMIEWSCL